MIFYSLFAYLIVSTHCSIIDLDLSEFYIGIPTQTQDAVERSIAAISFQLRRYGTGGRTCLANTTSGETVQVSVVPILPPTPPTVDSGYDSTSIDSFILLPGQRPRIVLNPTDPTDHFAHGNFATVQSSSRYRAEVRASVSILPLALGNYTNVEHLPLDVANTVRFSFDGSDLDAIPEESMNQLYAEILARGIPIRAEISYGDVRRIHLVQYTDEWIALLPTIQYTILSATGTPVAIVHLTGDDYVIRDPSGTLAPQIGIVSSRTPRFGFKFLSSIPTFVDNRNQMIGFGEPVE